jgi:hypothetical protein
MFNPVKPILAVYQNGRDIFLIFKRRRMLPLFFLTLILIIISIVFAFLVFVPVLSPFVYPLF